jgi:signal transduction histidine kinase/CheY-like chemotaxis protein
MTTEAGLLLGIGFFSLATSTPQGLFVVATLVWLLLIVVYVFAWRSNWLPATWIPHFLFKARQNNPQLLSNLLTRTRDLAQSRRVYGDQLEVILEHVNLLVALLDERNYVTYSNKAFKHLSLRDEADEPQPLLTLLSLTPDDEQKLRAAMTEARACGATTTHVRVRSNVAAEPRQFNVCLERASDIPGTNHLILSLQDVTQSERDFQSLLEARKVDLLGRLTSSLVHDFNNLLFVVRSGTDLVALALPEDHDVQPDLKAIRDATNQAATLASEMLALARSVPATEGPCSPSENLQGMEKMLHRLVGRQITLEIDSSSDSSSVGISSADWQQILLNLVINAIQAVGREGKIRISVRDQSQDFVVLAVQDNGSGIAQEPRNHLFEPFFTTKSSQGCAGLGLSTVKSIVERAGGRVEVTSSPETGTQVDVQLPKAKDLRMSADTPSVQPNGNAPKLLVLDDEEQVRRLMVRLLSRDGYNIIEAAGLREALEKAKSTDRLDVWVTDANVDGTDATDAVADMRQLHPNVAIVLVSGREPDQDKMDLLQEQGVTFLPKPFTPAELRQSIDQAYRRGLATSTVVSLSAESVSVADRQAR